MLLCRWHVKTSSQRWDGERNICSCTYFQVKKFANLSPIWRGITGRKLTFYFLCRSKVRISGHRGAVELPSSRTWFMRSSSTYILWVIAITFFRASYFRSQKRFQFSKQLHIKVLRQLHLERPQKTFWIGTEHKIIKNNYKDHELVPMVLEQDSAIGRCDHKTPFQERLYEKWFPNVSGFLQSVH